MCELEKTQGKLVKAILGLNRYSHNTPILQALKADNIAVTVGINSLNLLRSCLMFPSNASLFYARLLHCNDKSVDKTLISRAKRFALEHDIDVLRYVLDTKYKSSVVHDLRRSSVGQDGLVDSVRMLLDNYYVDNARDMLQLLVASF